MSRDNRLCDVCWYNGRRERATWHRSDVHLCAVCADLWIEPWPANLRHGAHREGAPRALVEAWGALWRQGGGVLEAAIADTFARG